MSETRLADVKVGDRVRAFHPRTFGVIYPGEVVKVGRTLVHVRFNVDDRTYRLAPRYVVEVS